MVEIATSGSSTLSIESFGCEMVEGQVQGGTCMRWRFLRLWPKPRLPTKLAQICNVNYVRIDEFVAPLENKVYLKCRNIDGHDVIAITGRGWT